MANISINPDVLKPQREWKRHKVTDGENVFRFLPPFGENAEMCPYRKWSVTWGLIDPQTGKKRPFASPQEGPCPIYEYYGLLKKKVEEIKNQHIAAGLTEDQVKETMKSLNEWLREIQPKRSFAYNACTLSGEVGVADIKKTAHDMIIKEMLKYIQEYNQDPCSLNSVKEDSGVWFVITRTGTGRDTKYEAKIKKTLQDHPEFGKVEVLDRTPLPENVVENYADLGYDLLDAYQKKSYDELKEILILNLQEIIKRVPEAAIEGFVELPELAEAPQEAQPQESVPQGKGTVALSLGTPEPDEPAPEPTPAPAAKTAETAAPAATTPEITDDLNAMVDDILADV